jgi:hypothetical protein
MAGLPTMSNGGFEAHDDQAAFDETAILTGRMEHVRMFNRTDNDRVVSELEYRAAVAEFDRLWGLNTSSEDQMTMERLIRVIDAFESARSIPPADVGCVAFGGRYAACR